MKIENLKSIADGISMLLTPHTEVVIHDMETGKIAYLANPLSGRSVGDASLIDPELAYNMTMEDVIGPYEKAGARGQRISSITVVIRDDGGSPLFLVCINLDFSSLESALDILESFIRPRIAISRPDILFMRDWRESIKIELRAFLLQTGITLDSLTPEYRQELVSRFNSRGLFAAKKATDQVAEMLGVSRATIYNDLAKLNRKNRKP